MKRLLITGGTGTVGSAFVERFQDRYTFAVVSRNEKMQYEMRQRFPSVDCYLASIEDKEAIFCAYDKFQPDVVVHAAAIKHVDVAERQPIQTTMVNVVGSLNVISASVEFNVPVTVAISTDKACEHQHVYGITKFIMEQCFLEANGDRNHFGVCRFGNVAHSNGSVIPYWLKLKKENQPIKLTSPDMNRLMFLPCDAADLVQKSVDYCSLQGGFILSRQMKNVNMLRLAKKISNNVEIVGTRPGEKFDEDLVSSREMPYSRVVDGDYIIINKDINKAEDTRLQNPYNTRTAVDMTDEELDRLINNQG